MPRFPSRPSAWDTSLPHVPRSMAAKWVLAGGVCAPHVTPLAQASLQTRLLLQSTIRHRMSGNAPQ